MNALNHIFFAYAFRILLTILVFCFGGWPLAQSAGDGGTAIPLYAGKPYLHVMHGDRSVKVQRVQDPEYQLRGYYARTARKCPPFCLVPEQVEPRVGTFGEIEVFDFMENQLRDGTGLLIDARTEAWFRKGTIPGSINVPFTLLGMEPGDLEFVEILELFGVRPRGDVGFVDRQLESWGLAENPYLTEEWDFSRAKELVIWCNGPACGQSPRAIKGLLGVGYPPDKIFYYRGGMQLWQLFGLTTVVPQ